MNYNQIRWDRDNDQVVITEGRNLAYINLSGYTITAEIYGASGVNFDRCLITESSLRGAILDCHWYGATIVNSAVSSFSLTRVSNCKFTNCTFSVTKLSGPITCVEFISCTFTDSYFIDKVDDCEFLNCKLGYDIFRLASLRHVVLNGSSGIFDPVKWMKENLVWDGDGYLCYKRISTNGETAYPIPHYWKIEPGSFIEEEPNRNPAENCGSGVNVGTREWAGRHYRNVNLWECRILAQDLPNVVIPIATDGKFRAKRVQLLGIVENEQKRTQVKPY